MFEEAAAGGIGGSDVIRNRMIEMIEIPTPICGKGCNRIPACVEHFPQLLGRADVAWKPTSHPDNRYWLMLLRLQFVELLFGLLERDGGFLEICPKFLLAGLAHSLIPLISLSIMLKSSSSLTPSKSSGPDSSSSSMK